MFPRKVTSWALSGTQVHFKCSVDSRNKVVDLRSLEKRHVPAEVLEGVAWTTLLYMAKPKRKFLRV
jgi:hypothetical protein